MNIKASFKYISEQQKTFFKKSKCVPLINVKKALYEGEMFEKTINLINSSKWLVKNSW